MRADIVFNSAKENTYFIMNLSRIIYELNVLGYEVIVRASMKSRDLEYYVQNLKECDVLVVSGGDGTLHEVTNGLCFNDDIDPKILYFMSGTVNDVAHSLKLKDNVDFMINLLKADEYKTIDCGRINDRYFIYICAFGAFTQSSYNTTNKQKAHLKRAAYVLNGISEISNISKSYNLEITIDDDETIKDNFQIGLISNSSSVAGIRNLFKNDEIDDGYFNLYLTKINMTVFDQAFKTMVNGITMANDNEKDTIVRRFKNIKIKASNEVIWTLDGERGPNGNVEIEVIPAKIKIYAPNKEEIC